MELSETNADGSKRPRWLFVGTEELWGVNLPFPLEFISNNSVGE